MEKHLSIRQREYNFLANRVPTPTLHTSGSHFSVSLKTHRFAAAYSRFPGFGIISKSPVLERERERKVRERNRDGEFRNIIGKTVRSGTRERGFGSLETLVRADISKLLVDHSPTLDLGEGWPSYG